MPESLQTDERLILKEFLHQFFNLDELEDIVFDLGISFGSFSGSISRNKFVRELIKYCERHHLIDCLLLEVARRRDAAHERLGELIAKFKSCFPRKKMQIILEADELTISLEMLKQIIASICPNLSEEDIIIIAAARGSIRLLLSLPEHSQDELLRWDTLERKPLPVRSIDGFAKLGENEQSAWRSVAKANPAPLHGTLPLIVIWEEIIEERNKQTKYTSNLTVVNDFHLPSTNQEHLETSDYVEHPMNKIRVLVVGSAQWAAIRAGWFRDRKWQVTERTTWSGETWPAAWGQQYDLLILEEGTWLRAAPGPVPQDYPLVLVAGERSAAIFRQVRESGAQYVSRGEDQESLIRTAEEQLRRVGRLPKHGRILIVDDDPSVRSALRRRLLQEGYEVFVAADRQETLSIIENERPHVAIIDFVLDGPQKPTESVLLEPLDQSGFDLILGVTEHFGHAMRVVGLTPFTNDGIAARAVGRMARFVHKNERYETEIIPKVEEAYSQLGINNSLAISFEQPLSLSYLVNMMKVYRNCSEQEKQRAVIELEELLRKSFARELQVKGYYLSPGRGGSGVVLMRPTVQGIRGKNFVIKFGPRHNVAIELQNYQTYAQPFISNRTHLIDISDRPVETHNLGALKFSLVGEHDQSPQDFNSFYQQPGVSVEAIGQVFECVFNQTFARWYAGKRDWDDNSPGALARSYESHLSLDQPERWQELESALQVMANGNSYHGIAFRLKKPDTLSMTLDDDTITLPNPIHYVTTHRADFRPPRFTCITHGALNGRNMFVDQEMNVWLIDFFKTGWGPILRDFGELETVIRFELLRTSNLTALYEFEKAILSPRGFDQPISFQNRFGLAELDKAMEALILLRLLAQSVYESADMYEYYVGLLYYALWMITWDGISSVDQSRYPTRQRHALLSAALIAHRLQHWDD